MVFLRIKYKCKIFVIIFYLKMLMRPTAMSHKLPYLYSFNFKRKYVNKQSKFEIYE